ncbi:hypothetical protein GCM10022225_16460 [Plantactinospora mayteni]|uniref:Uncharacterized protein n=1 Tax=Plantactinospora mayteni TaxID=566021 RepID=A0ABQ4EG67_9ACTN|nr:hypothetical protein Pma05_02930 [Plantactinospora mayteni]
MHSVCRQNTVCRLPNWSFQAPGSGAGQPSTGRKTHRPRPRPGDSPIHRTPDALEAPVPLIRKPGTAWGDVSARCRETPPEAFADDRARNYPEV